MRPVACFTRIDHSIATRRAASRIKVAHGRARKRSASKTKRLTRFAIQIHSVAQFSPVEDPIATRIASRRIERAHWRTRELPTPKPLRHAGLSGEIPTVAHFAHVEHLISAWIAVRRIERAHRRTRELPAAKALRHAGLSRKIGPVARFTDVDRSIATRIAVRRIEQTSGRASERSPAKPLGYTRFAIQIHSVATFAHIDHAIATWTATGKVEVTIGRTRERTTTESFGDTSLPVQIRPITRLVDIDAAIATPANTNVMLAIRRAIRIRAAHGETEALASCCNERIALPIKIAFFAQRRLNDSITTGRTRRNIEFTISFARQCPAHVSKVFARFARAPVAIFAGIHHAIATTWTASVARHSGVSSQAPIAPAAPITAHASTADFTTRAGRTTAGRCRMRGVRSFRARHKSDGHSKQSSGNKAHENLQIARLRDFFARCECLCRNRRLFSPTSSHCPRAFANAKAVVKKLPFCVDLT